MNLRMKKRKKSHYSRLNRHTALSKTGENTMRSLYLKAFFSGLLLLVIARAVLAANTFSEPLPPPTVEEVPNDNDSIPSSVPSINENTDIIIIQKKDALIEEVRVDGKLRYAKITPKTGKPYYMYDSDGDGILDATETDMKKANVNQWILMEWQ